MLQSPLVIHLSCHFALNLSYIMDQFDADRLGFLNIRGSYTHICYMHASILACFNQISCADFCSAAVEGQMPAQNSGGAVGMPISENPN